MNIEKVFGISTYTVHEDGNHTETSETSRVAVLGDRESFMSRLAAIW